MKKIIIAGANRLMLFGGEGKLRLPFEGEVDIPSDAETFVFGNYVALSLPNMPDLSDGLVWKGLRESWATLQEDDYAAASKASELLNWNASERYCGNDGSPLERCSEISKRCPRCGKEYFPRLNPAVVVLVTRGEEALLVHSRNLKGDVHALVAGFVETGESLEECVAREIREETSLEVGDIRYVGSQAWPFPYQLMMGFTACYRSGEVVFSDGELTSGGFFTRDNIPEIPSPPSLSRKIIDLWISGDLPKKNEC